MDSQSESDAILSQGEESVVRQMISFDSQELMEISKGAMFHAPTPVLVKFWHVSL